MSSPPADSRIAGGLSAPSSATRMPKYEADILPMMEELEPVGIEMARSSWQPRRQGVGNRRLRQGRDRGNRKARSSTAPFGMFPAAVHASAPRGYKGHRAVDQEGRRPRSPPRRAHDHINASYVRSHFDGMEMGVPGVARTRRARPGAGDDHRCARP